MKVLFDVPFLDPGREETLDLYLHENDSPLRPAVVWIHGGGWSGGSKCSSREVIICTALAEEGFVVASIDYQLGQNPQNPIWPQPLLDCKNAVRFLRANAKTYNINAECIAVMGSSAGGYLALMTAFTTDIIDFEPASPYPDVSSKVSAAGNFYGVTNFLTWRHTLEDGTPAKQLKDYDLRHLLAKTRNEDEALWRFASPVTHITKNAPPVFNTHGKKDTTVDYLQAVELDETLKKVGVTCETVLLENAGHTYDLGNWNGQKLEKNLRPLVVDFLRCAFANK